MSVFFNAMRVDVSEESIKFSLSGEAEAGSAGEQPARNTLTKGNSEEVENQSTSSIPFTIYLVMPQKTQKQIKMTFTKKYFLNLLLLNTVPLFKRGI